MIAIPNMGMPDTCDMCPIEGCEYINGKFTCPLIEIVTCGECKYHAEDGWGYGNCERPFVNYLRTANYDFCPYGERRTK